MNAEPRLERNEDRSRYELWQEGELVGTLKYRVDPDAMVLVHTRVDPAYEGHGYGSRLVAGALADLRAKGVKVVVECDFARAYIERHPEHQDLVLERSA